MVPEVGIAPTSPRLQRGANLSKLLRVVVPSGNAPLSSGYQPGALLLSYGTVFDLRFDAEAHRAEDKVQLPRLDSDTVWFVAPAKEQLALISKNWFHETSFC